MAWIGQCKGVSIAALVSTHSCQLAPFSPLQCFQRWSPEITANPSSNTHFAFEEVSLHLRVIFCVHRGFAGISCFCKTFPLFFRTVPSSFRPAIPSLDTHRHCGSPLRLSCWSLKQPLLSGHEHVTRSLHLKTAIPGAKEWAQLFCTRFSNTPWVWAISNTPGVWAIPARFLRHSGNNVSFPWDRGICTREMGANTKC